MMFGCAPVGPPPPMPSFSPTPAVDNLEKGTPYALNNDELSIIDRGVRNALKDPASGVITSVSAAKSSDGVVSACGFVNGKNSYGGYTGRQPFMGVLTQKAGFFVIKIGSTQNEAIAVATVCERTGVI